MIMEKFKGRAPLVPQPKYLTAEEAEWDTLTEVNRAISARMAARRRKATSDYTKLLKAIDTEEERALEASEAHIAAKDAAKAGRANGRRRQPLALTRLDERGEGWNFPPNVTSEQVEKRIDDICTCGGKYDCDCVSVFNQAKREMWYEHNTGESYSLEERRKDTTDGY